MSRQSLPQKVLVVCTLKLACLRSKRADFNDFAAVVTGAALDLNLLKKWCTRTI